MSSVAQKRKVALMSYAMDHREAKGTALYTRKLVEQLVSEEQEEFEYYLIHYETVDDPLYSRAREIIMPRVRLPYGSHFVSQLLFFLTCKERFDIMHWFQPRLYPFYFLAPADKLVVTVHGAGQITLRVPTFDLSKEIFNIVMARLHQRAAAFIAVSQFGRKEIIEHYHTDPAKTFVTYLGVDTGFEAMEAEEAQARARTYGIESPYVLDVSRLQPHKNVESLIRAYIDLRAHYPERKEKLVIVGTALPGSEDTLAIAKHSPYKDDIRFIPFVQNEDLNAVYSAAEVFVFPSLLEGFGLPLLEAMAAGVPIITSNVSALPEVAGDAALLVAPTDIEALREAMQRMLSDKAVRDEYRARGIARARAFTWKRTAEETRAIYRALLPSA